MGPSPGAGRSSLPRSEALLGGVGTFSHSRGVCLPLSVLTPSLGGHVAPVSLFTCISSTERWTQTGLPAGECSTCHSCYLAGRGGAGALGRRRKLGGLLRAEGSRHTRKRQRSADFCVRSLPTLQMGQESGEQRGGWVTKKRWLGPSVELPFVYSRWASLAGPLARAHWGAVYFLSLWLRRGTPHPSVLCLAPAHLLRRPQDPAVQAALPFLVLHCRIRSLIFMKRLARILMGITWVL